MQQQQEVLSNNRMEHAQQQQQFTCGAIKRKFPSSENFRVQNSTNLP